VIPAVLAVAAAFNLVCSGTTYIGAGMDALKKENQSAYAATFRIDLDAERWCAGDCKTTEHIYAIGLTKIMLKLERDEKIPSESFISLNREDGSVLDRSKVADFMIMHIGKCERAPFSGFPIRKF